MSLRAVILFHRELVLQVSICRGWRLRDQRKALAQEGPVDLHGSLASLAPSRLLHHARFLLLGEMQASPAAM